MLDLKYCEELAKQLFAALPNQLKALEEETEQKFKEALYALFARMDLVTREEFDIQANVLARTREKLEVLQKQVIVLMEKDKDER